ncbi:hypothetical protein LPJ64_000229 [Coemansia asiatica]|uniref:Uncharacterized protein n=1 Tax=Coemansia asiatica TaxID=1052880 RepID=A0A9W7XSA9_9FUNG|nr:hypothetical protein LPJ64_000229 [Coemansia asiatica]
MKRSFINSILVALAVACVSSARPVEEPLATPETSPAAVIRGEYAAPTATAAPAHSATVALPPPLTIAYQDQCNPCCANCVTYSDLHIDTDCDECCKPAAVIKTHHFVKEINYKCCTGDVSLSAQMARTTATDAANLAAITTMPAAIMTLAAASLAATTTNPAAATTNPAAAIITMMTAAATTTTAAAIMTLAAATITTALSSIVTTTTTVAASITAATTARTTAAATTMIAATTMTAATTTTAAAITTTTTAASALSTTAAARRSLSPMHLLITAVPTTA